MSDGKEVKRFKIRHFDEIEGLHFESGLVVSASDHDRIVAERNAEQKLLVTKVIDLSRYVDELRAELNQLKMMYDGLMVSARITRESNAKTIATQARAIEKLKGMVSHYETCATVDRYDDEDVPCDCGLEKELAAIEKEGEKDD